MKLWLWQFFLYLLTPFVMLMFFDRTLPKPFFTPIIIRWVKHLIATLVKAVFRMLTNALRALIRLLNPKSTPRRRNPRS